MHEYGANLSLKTTFKGQELTPLMIAAAKGHEKSVKKLMRLGASLVHSKSINVTSSSKVSLEEQGTSKASATGTVENQSRRQYRRSSFREERKKEQTEAHHEAAINLALRNKHPIIAEMILRDITLKDAVGRKDDKDN
jgi:ankyrin repeat protein